MEYHLNHRVSGVQSRQRKNFLSQGPQRSSVMIGPRVYVKGYSLGRERNLKGRRNVKVAQRSDKRSPFRDVHLPCRVCWRYKAQRRYYRHEQSGKYLEKAMSAYLRDSPSRAIQSFVCTL